MRAEPKDGGSGRFWLVTVGHMISQDDQVCVDEEQDLVFREASAAAPPGPDRDDAPEAPWVEQLVADPVLLFRFSAVTANAHRIHYDRPYATDIEGYPDLVVHGPLTAILLSELAASTERPRLPRGLLPRACAALRQPSVLVDRHTT